MCKAVIRALEENFGYTLASPEVVVLDPCTGTGNFVVSLIEKMPGNALEGAYRERIFANEVMLLPYYVASLNIEHAFYARMNRYDPFPGICFADTLDMAESQQYDMFTPANTERVEKEKKSAITVIIGNPPYNVGQKKENDNNKNRRYKVLDEQVRLTYSKDSRASSKSKLSGDPYVRFFRWSTNRLGQRDGIVCFVSNNNFVDDYAFDGMRSNLEKDFELIDHLDLHGDRRQNPKISGTTHNVFGIQLGVGITLAVRKRGAKRRIRYFRVPEMWRRSEKLEFVAAGNVPWRTLHPDARHTWIVPDCGEQYSKLLPITELFSVYTMGLNTNRDEVVYDFDKDLLGARVKQFILDYNTEVDRHRHDRASPFDEKLRWSSRLKECLARGVYAKFEEAKIKRSVYRPFTKKWVFLDAVINQRTAKWNTVSGLVIAVPGPGNRKQFGAFMSDTILPLDLAFEKIQCFPLSQITDEAVVCFQKHYKDDGITRENIFHYLYAMFNHPEYRDRFAACLKLELPRIPYVSGFRDFVEGGRRLAALHVGYENIAPWPLTRVETPGVPYSETVTKMRLSADRKTIEINESLTLSDIPSDVFEYQLGSRSALEWLVDQYQIKGCSDPNRDDDAGYIVRLVGQVVRVSLETLQTVRALPPIT
jgi:predicted helicase